MPKQISQTELDVIRELVGQFPEGASLEKIAGALGKDMPRRTLQRRLSGLVKSKHLTRVGAGPGTRYQVPIVHDMAIERLQANAKLRAEYVIEVSPEGEKIRSTVCQPIQNRKPVGYSRAFLDDYRPNASFYLTPNIRQHLFDSGRSSAGEEPAGTYVLKIYNRLLIDLSWNSSRLEGNTYTLLETDRLLALGETVEGKDARDAQMILNHKAAIEFLVGQADEVGFNRYTLLNLHALLADNLLPDPESSGRLRHIPVGIDGTVYHPLEIPQVIDECFQTILDYATVIDDPLEQSFFVMVHLPYLQPFEDVNKRVSRLAANIPLVNHNLSPLSFVDVPTQAYIDGMLGVYELNRIELLRDVFVWAYERSCARYSAVRQSLGNPDTFRIRYRAAIAQLVSDVVLGKMSKSEAVACINKHSKENVRRVDQNKFIEIVETELMHLHEGNIARYRIRPSEFDAWREHWH